MTQPSLKVILGADALLQPTTGIGSYARNLAINLKKEKSIAELHLFAHGVFLQPSILGEDESDGCESLPTGSSKAPPPVQPHLLSRARSVLSRSAWATHLYQLMVPRLERRQLLRYRDAVFHSPNYILPPFAGRSVVTFHDLSIQRYPEFHPPDRVKLLEQKMEDAARRACHIITDTELVRREVIEHYGAPADTVSAIPLAAGAQFMVRAQRDCESVLKNWGLQYRKFFLFVSTIEPRKNIRRICAAFKDLRQNSEIDYPLIFVGHPGWSSAKEHEDIRELEARGWARYLNYVDARTLPVLYSAASALIFPSIYEGFGLPALEAQQSGTPVVTSRGSAMEEFSANQDVLVNPLEVSEIRGAMETIVAHRGEVAEPKLESPLPCASMTWRQTAAATSNIYSRVLGSS